MSPQKRLFMAKIRVDKVTKIFGNHPQKGLQMLDAGKPHKAIRDAGYPVGCADVSFDVEQGELLVVMGLSGSGKSTLIRCLNALNSVTRGHIYVDDEDITAFDRKQLLDFRRRKVSMVFQNFALFPHRTVIDNAAYGLEVQGMDSQQRRGQAREALQLVGLEGWEDNYPDELSGGMKQRVGLARALAVESDVLLMDEAFSALDPLIRSDMQHELVRMQQRLQKTIVFITHDLDEALQIGDRIVLMKDGRVVQFDKPEAILTNPANDYVERFVENVDVSRTLTASAVLTRARVVAFDRDGPRTVLHKMNEENYTSLVVVKRDYTFVGTITLDAADKAVREGRDSIAGLIDTTPSIVMDTPLTEVINQLADWPFSLPVVDAEAQLLGVVTRTGVIAVLAGNTPSGAIRDDGEDASQQSATQHREQPEKQVS